MSTDVGSTPGRRRTQEERSATTRRALLEATIDCLVEEGYANLTTTKVAARARVSRGAQVHHFPTKATLVTEAVQYLIGQVSQSLFSEVGQLPAGQERAGRALDMLWQTFRGRLFQAALQLSMAGPADAEIEQKLTVLNQVTADLIRGSVPLLFPEEASHPDFEDALYTAINTMTGLALSQRVAKVSDAEIDARWRRTKAQLLKLIEPREASTGLSE
ncbi:TetR/AcrR family transcriptional regulator [Haloechinothrix sp. LS1_15]|uniref:TetR/AcrR family transcriptional regulator n=1 Tax=Haloechinothrix sp. LS1_15 TaxID=2652248 RepID=UPI0029462DDC|nr:TetR/AcrR family transcriptional regulator [Haloechinothrix sp. LS1_15]MDV6013765.1 TetR/AcrR family transcriptional regulator [Haloechinothrix sp. LS1_15]